MMQRFMIVWRHNDYVQAWNKVNYDEISIPAMKETWQFVKEFTFWFLAYPKAKYDFATEHFILWEKDNKESDEKYRELYDLIEKFSKSNYTCLRNPISIQTIPAIIHYHIAKFKDMDKEITKLL